MQPRSAYLAPVHVLMLVLVVASSAGGQPLNLSATIGASQIDNLGFQRGWRTSAELDVPLSSLVLVTRFAVDSSDKGFAPATSYLATQLMRIYWGRGVFVAAGLAVSHYSTEPLSKTAVNSVAGAGVNLRNILIVSYQHYFRDFTSVNAVASDRLMAELFVQLAGPVSVKLVGLIGRANYRPPGRTERSSSNFGEIGTGLSVRF